MPFRFKDYSQPPDYEIYNPVVRFLRKKMGETGMSVEAVSNAAGLDTKTVRKIFNGEHPGKFSTITTLAAAFGYEIGLKKVSEPVWTIRAGRRTFGAWGRANNPIGSKD